MSAIAELQDAINAIRHLKEMPAQLWQRTFPEFATAIDDITFHTLHSEHAADRIDAIERELSIRIGEALIELLQRCKTPHATTPTS